MDGDLVARPAAVRHVPRLRCLEVIETVELSPRMRQIVLGGEELDGFVSLAPDDHVKLFLPPGVDPVLPRPGPDGLAWPQDRPRPVARDYTPRLFDPGRRRLSIEFALHGDGPATRWAQAARPGTRIAIGGPRSSRPPADDGAPILLVGDETALPAIAETLLRLSPGTPVVALVEVEDRGEERALPGATHASVSWLHRNGAAPGQPERLLAALRTALPWVVRQQRLSAWVACEIDTARQLRQVLIEEAGLRRERIRAAGYWRRGEAGAHQRIDA